MRERPELSIPDYYERTSEELRHERGSFVLEKARTQELIKRFIPPATPLAQAPASTSLNTSWLPDILGAIPHT